MGKVTKKELQYQINGLAAEASTRHNSIMRIHRALASIGVDIFSDDFDLTEPEPQLKQLDQSVFNGLDEKWRFAVIQNNGFALICTKLPFVAFGGSSWDWNGYSNVVGKGYDASNWQNSLIERDIAKELLEVDLSSELTGSDLCRAMLERGDNYIMCVVGALRALVIIDTLQDGKFYSFGAMYENPIPINNQGEPLTAADVGL